MVRKDRKNEANELYENASVSDWVKKNLLDRLGALIISEEGLRQELPDLKLPKGVLSAALAQADRTKREISKLMIKEVRLFLEGIELSELIKKVLKGQGIEISAKIKFISEDDEVKKPAKKIARKKVQGKKKLS